MMNSDTTNWGIGFCWIPLDSNIIIYDSPNGNKVGHIARFSTESRLGFKVSISGYDGIYLAHSHLSFNKVYERNNGHLKIWEQSIKNGYWVKVEDGGAQLINYESILVGDYDQLMGVESSIVFSTHNLGPTSQVILYSKPRMNSDSIGILAPNYYDSTNWRSVEILKSKNEYLKVKVTYGVNQGNGANCCGGCEKFEIAGTKTGWIRTLSENGKPNIWFPYDSYRINWNSKTGRFEPKKPIPFTPTKIQQDIVGIWKQISPESDCPIYLKLDTINPNVKSKSGFYMRGSCDFRMVRRVWFSRGSDIYRDYRDSRYDLDSNNVIYFPSEERIENELITIIDLGQDTLKISIYNSGKRQFEILTMTRVLEIPHTIRYCECEWRSD
jgi:hypothetical protein